MTEPANVVQFNFGLSWKQITAAFAGVVAMVGAGATAGWMTVPYANKTDLKIIEQHVEGMRKDIGDLQMATVDLTDALRELQDVVAALKASGGGGAASPEVTPTRRLPSKRKTPTDAWREGRKTKPPATAWSPF